MENASQPELLRALADDKRSVDQSVDNGYFAEEPLVVVPVAREVSWTVVEGNRRLALERFNDSAQEREIVLSPWVPQVPWAPSTR